MRMVVLQNPIAGRGRAASMMTRVAEVLESHDHEVHPLATTSDGNDTRLREALTNASLLIVIGGDGTVRHAASAATAHDVPIYQLPLGTENLFAREFGMNQDPGLLLRAIDRWDIRRVDLAAAAGEPFLMMASLGFDAAVIHDLAARRTGSISHLSYVAPIVRTIFRWKPVPVDVTVDGASLALHGPGITIVASARQYAARLDPVPHASPTDGQLHVVHLPIRGTLGLLLTILKVRLRRHLKDERITRAHGRTIHIQSATPVPVQVDGDVHQGCSPAAPLDVTMTIRPGVLPVLIPPPSGSRGMSRTETSE